MSFVEGSVPQQRFYGEDVFPLVLDWQSSETAPQQCTAVIQWLKENVTMIGKTLLDHKGILFRCHNCISSHDEFHQFIEALNFLPMDYVGGAAVRTQLTSKVFTANESPSTENIPFHHEMAQTPNPPTHLFFFCERAPTVGGATPILVSAEVCDRLAVLQPDFMKDLEQCGVQYVRVIPEFDDPTSAIGRGWRSTYQCTDRAGAEAALRSLGSSWEWREDGSLVTVTATVPAIRTDDQPAGAARTGQKTFFNSVVAAYTGWNDSRNEGRRAVVLGDGRLLPPEAIEDAVAVMQDICVAFAWKSGDVLLLDNRTVMHSRQSFEGPRRILASLARDPER